MPEHQFKGRREDARLVTGRGLYTADHTFSEIAAAHFVRSDRAHAKITRIDATHARTMPGVVDILTGDDLIATGWKGTPSTSFFKGIGGSSLRVPFRSGLALGRVRFVGEPVALVVANSEHIAQDAAESIEIEYEDLPVMVEASAAVAEGAARLHEELPDNLRSTTSTVTDRPLNRHLARQPMWFMSSFGPKELLAIRWSRSPVSLCTMRQAARSNCASQPRVRRI